MEKEKGKDYFGFQGQAENYQKYRPQYPKEFIDALLAKECLKPLKYDLVLDIGTGTGFLARHFSSISKRAIGTDLSEA